MPKRIENPLIEGLPAKVYFLCYLEPQTGYGLSKEIHGYVRGTDKIYGAIDRLVDEGFLKKCEPEGKKKPYQANTKPLLKAIKQKLLDRSQQLTTKEEKRLSNIINSCEFKQYVQDFYQNQIGRRQLTYDGKAISVISHPDFNALMITSHNLGMAATVAYINLEFKQIPLEHDEKFLEKSYKKSNPNDWKTLLEGIKKFNKMISYFKDFSNDSLRKLSILWPASHEMIVSEYVDFYRKNKKTVCPKCGYAINIKRKVK